MAVYRQIHIEFWQDPFILELTPEEKYFYLYLMTNSKTTQCGIYELPKRVIEFETGYNRETVEKLLQRFIDYKKITYNESTKEVFILNWLKFNPINNTNIEKCVLKELEDIKNQDFIESLLNKAIGMGYKIPLIQGAYKGLIRGLYTPTKKEEKEEEKEEEKIPCRKIAELYNNTCKSLSNIKTLSNNRKKAIKARWNQYNQDISIFEDLFNKAESSNFLKGNNDRNWKADFDWLMNEQNMTKVLEGKYINKVESGGNAVNPRNTKTSGKYDDIDFNCL